jgi:2-polyprenyl-3-methyl-5-hydroxy-6-metoxy-1,4-benzoquinol methylase
MSEPHSEAYFGDTRDFWWNRDFLELMVRRWSLKENASILDVGCGVGHWGRALMSVCTGAHVIGFDREPEWILKATQRAQAASLPARYFVGDASAFELDEKFDVVTCQTLLIHVPQVEHVLERMKKHLKPGGLLLCAEPNNLSAGLLLGKSRFDSPLNELLAQVKLQLMCERGKQKLGLGHNSIGELVPGMFSRMGMKNVQVFQSDNADALFPPYASPKMTAHAKEALAFATSDFWWWSREETKRYYMAAEGTDEEFEILWKHAMTAAKRSAAMLKENAEEKVGNGAFFLVSGRT